MKQMIRMPELQRYDYPIVQKFVPQNVLIKVGNTTIPTKEDSKKTNHSAYLLQKNVQQVDSLIAISKFDMIMNKK